MSENEDLKKVLVQALSGIDKLIQREGQVERLQKAAAEASKRLELLDEKTKAAQTLLKELEAGKEALLASSKREAIEILDKAKAKDAEADKRLASSKRTEQAAQDKLKEAELAQAVHQSALEEVLAQKRRLKEVLA